ncbi:MAG TPA: histidinol-phosphate transaminase [Acidimicrobiales bacterium]|nr:histidinol-phosphate transaminase [Acidimicrobiales bacterium]
MKLRDDLGDLEGYHSPQVDVAVRLNTNESPYPPPDAWREALLDELASLPFHRYPEREATELRRAIGELHGVGPEQVLAANGSNEVIQALCLAFGGPGRAAAVFKPTYLMHSHIARITGTPVVEGERDATTFALDMAEVTRVVGREQPAITFLCSPNNPSGQLDPPEAIEKVLSLGPGLVVVDEAYGQFSPRSAIEQVRAGRPLAVVRTFSKTWSMAAARLGYLVGPRDIISAVEGVVLPYHLDAMKQAAGRLALRFQGEMESRVALIVEERGRLAAGLGELPVDTWPSAANFILFRPRTKDGDKVWDELVERSVLVRNCASWPGLDGCLRVTVGTAEENDAFLRALREVLA